MKEINKLERELKKELRKEKRKAMLDAFSEGMSVDMVEEIIRHPAKTIGVPVLADFGIATTVNVLDKAFGVIIPKPIHYTIQYACYMALPVKLGITKAMEAGKRFDELTTVRA